MTALSQAQLDMRDHLASRGWPKPRAACAWDRAAKDMSSEDIEATLQAAEHLKSTGGERL